MTPKSDKETVAGIDWCRGAWVAVVLRRANASVCVKVGTDLEELITDCGSPSSVAIDMPIGLPEVRRDADRLAREFVGPRRSSVFSVPPAPVLAAATYEEAKQVAAGLLGGTTITKQAWALAQSIALVGELAERDERIAEVHPEVSFRALARREMDFSKASWNGQRARRRALEAAGILLPEELRGEAGKVPVADVLDAAAAAWSARRLVNREAESLPAGAAPGAHGVIWY